MVRKIIQIILVCALLCGAICTTASARTYDVYDNGTISSTCLTYFKDIVSGIGFNENYVAFRSDEKSYTLLVGDLEYNNGVISLVGSGKEYEITAELVTDNDNQYRYYVRDITDSSVSVGDNIIYSDVGYYPQLVERGAKYEILSAVLIVIICLCVVIGRIFGKHR